MKTEDLILSPLRSQPAGLRVLGVAFAALSAVWAYACARLLSEGHLGLGTASYGVSWGITVAGIVHVIGISHVGIAVSATVRVLRLERYRNVARLAEIVTLVALLLAVVTIGLDVGRPDRFLVNVLLYGRWHAPMVWSATVISLYFTASGVYLYLSMRRDIAQIARMPLRFRRVYEFLSFGYRDTEAARRRHDTVLFWLAIALVPIMVSVHSVYGFFFGLLGARAGWYNPLQPPYFVLGAVVSGFSALMVVMAAVRKLLGWRELLVDRTFRVFGAFLAFVVFLYLYFVFSEHVTAQFAAPPGERAVSTALLTGRYAGLFWAIVAGGLLAPFLVLFVQAVRKREVSVPAVVSAALVVNAAMLLKRVLLVLPPQQLPSLPLPMDPGVYRPTLLELTTTFGAYAFGGLLFVLVLCALPMVELPLGPAEEPLPAASGGGSARRIVIGATLAAGVGLIAWGVATRDHDLAPLKWILGLVLLATSPLQVSLEVER